MPKSPLKTATNKIINCNILGTCSKSNVCHNAFLFSFTCVATPLNAAKQTYCTWRRFSWLVCASFTKHNDPIYQKQGKGWSLDDVYWLDTLLGSNPYIATLTKQGGLLLTQRQLGRTFHPRLLFGHKRTSALEKCFLLYPTVSSSRSENLGTQHLMSDLVTPQFLHSDTSRSR